MLETASRAALLLLTGENWIDMAQMIYAQRTFYTSDGPDERRREEELGDEPHAPVTWTEKAPRDGSFLSPCFFPPWYDHLGHVFSDSASSVQERWLLVPISPAILPACLRRLLERLHCY